MLKLKFRPTKIHPQGLPLSHYILLNWSSSYRNKSRIIQWRYEENITFHPGTEILQKKSKTTLKFFSITYTPFSWRTENSNYYYYFGPCHAICGISVPWPGIEPRPRQWKPGILASRPPGNSPENNNYENEYFLTHKVTLDWGMIFNYFKRVYKRRHIKEEK